jgi:hypothetical protein
MVLVIEAKKFEEGQEKFTDLKIEPSLLYLVIRIRPGYTSSGIGFYRNYENGTQRKFFLEKL